jgi:N-acetylneuraminate synthase
MTNGLATIRIEGRTIGAGHPVYVIAEMSANHHQDFDQAVALVRAAKAAGADAIKLQTYTPDTLTIDSDAAVFRCGPGTPWSGRSLYELYGEAYTPWEWHPRLQDVASSLKMSFFSTPFDRTSVDFLASLNVPAFKIASFELVDTPLIEYVAQQGKPVIMSTGLATVSEMHDAVAAARRGGASELALLKCNSAYPAPVGEMNLRTIPHMVTEFGGIPIGLSDHTLGSVVAVSAVALGATIVEKHLVLSRSHGGPDAAFSLEPDEFAAMVQQIRLAEQALGNVQYEPTAQERQNRSFRRSLFVVSDVVAGAVFTENNVRSIRPAAGLPPRFLDEVLGRRALCDIARGTPLTWDHVAGADMGQRQS